MKVVVLADTHAPRRWRSCPASVAGHLRGADLILHAGDVCTTGVLEELAAYAPVRAVLGNNDAPDVAAWGAPGTLELEVGGRQFPAADLVIFGHSHIPLDHTEDGQRIFNPGSPTDRRRQPHGTIGLLDITDGSLLAARIVPVT